MACMVQSLDQVTTQLSITTDIGENKVVPVKWAPTTTCVGCAMKHYHSKVHTDTSSVASGSSKHVRIRTFPVDFLCQNITSFYF